MRKIKFLIKLLREGKLELVASNENIAKAYRQRSNESLVSAKTLLKIGNLKDSVALSYYAMYHYLLAILFRIGIKSENHTASIILLKEIFDIDNSVILKAKSERIDKPYYVDFGISHVEAEQTIITAENFISVLEEVLATLGEGRIGNLRKKFEEITKK